MFPPLSHHDKMGTCCSVLLVYGMFPPLSRHDKMGTCYSVLPVHGMFPPLSHHDMFPHSIPSWQNGNMLLNPIGAQNVSPQYPIMTCFPQYPIMTKWEHATQSYRCTECFPSTPSWHVSPSTPSCHVSPTIPSWQNRNMLLSPHNRQRNRPQLSSVFDCRKIFYMHIQKHTGLTRFHPHLKESTFG